MPCVYSDSDGFSSHGFRTIEDQRLTINYGIKYESK